MRFSLVEVSECCCLVGCQVALGRDLNPLSHTHTNVCDCNRWGARKCTLPRYLRTNALNALCNARGHFRHFLSACHCRGHWSFHLYVYCKVEFNWKNPPSETAIAKWTQLTPDEKATICAGYSWHKQVQSRETRHKLQHKTLVDGWSRRICRKLSKWANALLNEESDTCSWYMTEFVWQMWVRSYNYPQSALVLNASAVCCCTSKRKLILIAINIYS